MRTTFEIKVAGMELKLCITIYLATSFLVFRHKPKIVFSC